MKKFTKSIDNFLFKFILGLLVANVVIFSVIFSNLLAIVSVFYIYIAKGKVVSFEYKFERFKDIMITKSTDIILTGLKRLNNDIIGVEIVEEENSLAIRKPLSSFLLNLTGFLYSGKSQMDVFIPIGAEWQYEYFDDLANKRFWRAKFTNLRWTWHFISAMWQKSPIGDLIEFIMKVAK